MRKIGIIGAGASGLYAALNLVNDDTDITILEKNDSIGKKLLMTGNARCNISNAKYYDDFLENIIHNQKFIFSSFNKHDNYASMDFYNSLGLELVTEENDRVFPKTQKSIDVVKFFEKNLIKNNIKLVTEAKVMEIEKDDSFSVFTDDKVYNFDYLIIATGGLSYPSTGSSGDGYNFAKKFGHAITKTYPSLVPIYFKDKDLYDIKALNLEDISINIETDKATFSQKGSALLTKNFLTGPSILNISSHLVDKKINNISIDLLETNYEKLDQLLLENFNINPKKDISNILKEIIPQALVKTILLRSDISHNKKAGQINREERINIEKNIKNFELKFDRFGGFNTAVITRGGIDVNEVNPKTMESKYISNLYFIGEILDIDALTGGFNLQLAFTTAYAAADAIKETL
ncbi:NAD(P)/FAD-dependent oxidoreductase [uncultured Anaerococcus sp.]|uniref:NAD(P)/FAD-dependent oxidoreductase n=1 Tax=uncultured Anaerococcus sp. TaxID=293428 RepID=UPI0026279D31|nr:NAD(P)/FAD-dependent oxidoreductase [uncultured Anaerococcus sp.]